MPPVLVRYSHTLQLSWEAFRRIVIYYSFGEKGKRKRVERPAHRGRRAEWRGEDTDLERRADCTTPAILLFQAEPGLGVPVRGVLGCGPQEGENSAAGRVGFIVIYAMRR